MEEGGRQPHLFALHSNYAYRFIDNIPVEFRHLLCLCDNFKWVTNFDNVLIQPPKCGDCSKVCINNFYECGDCEVSFIRNFTTPWFCNYDNIRCWECAEHARVSGAPVCKCQIWRANKFGERAITPPVGNYSPAKKYSDEELYTIPDFTF